MMMTCMRCSCVTEAVGGRCPFLPSLKPQPSVAAGSLCTVLASCALFRLLRASLSLVLQPFAPPTAAPLLLMLRRLGRAPLGAAWAGKETITCRASV